jgi:reverse gyrase
MDTKRKPGTALALPDDKPAKALALLQSANKTLAEVSTMSDAWAAIKAAKLVDKAVRLLNVSREASNEAVAITYRAKQLFREFAEEGQAKGTIARRGQHDTRRVTVTTPM